MSSRYTETEKWSDPWFQNLPHGSKLLFLYLCDQCNIAGFYEVNKRELCFHLGIEEKQYEGAIKALGRGVKEADGWLWLKNFLKHQRNNDLNPENAAHRGILRLLREQLQRFKGIKEFDDMVGATKGLASPTVMSCNVKKEEGVQGRKPKGTVEELRAYAPVIGLPESDGQFCFDKWEGNGWKVDGRSIRDWQATLRTWKQLKILPSQRSGTNGTHPVKKGPNI